MGFRLVLTAAVVIGGVVETSQTAPRIVLDGARDALFIYAADGSLMLSISPTGGTDGTGIVYPSGLNVAAGNEARFSAANHSDGALTTAVYNDANARFVLAIDGTMNWGDGTHSPDTSLFRPQTNQLNTQGTFGVGGEVKVGTYIVREISSSDAVWQTVANGGIVLGAGWATDATAPGAQPLQYRIDAQDNLVIVGACHTTSAAPAATLFTLAGLYKPAALQRAAVDSSAGGVQSINRLNISSASGAVSLATAPTAASVDFYFDVCVPLGNMP